MEVQRKKVAIVGSGISGISAAHRLQNSYDVTIFEKDLRIGGHTSTVVIDKGEDEGLSIDTGFIVLNDKNYPRLHRFFKDLSVPVRWSDMSFGFSCEASDFAYAGTTLNGLFAQRKNLFDAEFWSILLGIYRFATRGTDALNSGAFRGLALKDLIAEMKLPQRCVDDYLLPMGAAIWSAPPEEILEFPAEAFLSFFQNHGLLGIKNRPRWQTVVGGSYTYVKHFRDRFRGEILTDSEVRSVRRGENGVSLSIGSEEHTFDILILATHADTTFKLLADPSDDERRLLSPWRYQENHTVLHSDTSALPKNRRAWASWNYVRESAGNGKKVSVSYHMNRLQGLKSKKEYCVTLNRSRPIAKDQIVAEFLYHHPCYTLESMATQDELHKLQGKKNTFFCGSYFGFGFHEDGIQSGESVAELLGCPCT